MPSNHLIICRPLLLLPTIFPSIRVFSNESALRIRWPKYCSFSFNISPSNEHPGLISFRMDWLDLLAVQGTLMSIYFIPTISVSVFPFSSYLKSFLASGSFQMSQLFVSGGQKYWSFSFNISPSNEHPGLISFRMDWCDLLAVQGTLKNISSDML